MLNRLLGCGTFISLLKGDRDSIARHFRATDPFERKASDYAMEGCLAFTKREK